MEGYCVKCKTKKEMQEAHEEIFKGKGNKDRRMLKGKCPECGTTICRILSSKDITEPKEEESGKLITKEEFDLKENEEETKTKEGATCGAEEISTEENKDVKKDSDDWDEIT